MIEVGGDHSLRPADRAEPVLPRDAAGAVAVENPPGAGRILGDDDVEHAVPIAIAERDAARIRAGHRVSASRRNRRRDPYSAVSTRLRDRHWQSTRSGQPSRFRSPATISKGPPPTVIVRNRSNPAPDSVRFSQIPTERSPVPACAKSGYPSRSKSATAIARGCGTDAISVLAKSRAGCAPATTLEERSIAVRARVRMEMSRMTSGDRKRRPARHLRRRPPLSVQVGHQSAPREDGRRLAGLVEPNALLKETGVSKERGVRARQRRHGARGLRRATVTTL